jgi:hypothetical protein
VFGGSASLAGDLSFADAAKLRFDAAITIAGTVSFAGSFGIADLDGLDSSVSAGTYTLIDGSLDSSNISNFGLDNAADIGGGRIAYFQEGSLQLVVVPEPVTLGLITSAAFGLLAFRRLSM